MQGGTQWDIIMNVLIKSRKYIDVNSYQFSDELATMKFLDQNPSVSNSLCVWLEKLNEIRSRTTPLTKVYRKNGNDAYGNVEWPDDLAADHYTNAIFSAPKDSMELALAHANRAACCLRGIFFPEEGYYDCQMALKFNYPLEKRNKLLQRKYGLSWMSKDKKEEKILETIREIEDFSKENLFSEKELRLEKIREQFKKWKSEKREETPIATNTSFQNKNLIEFESSMGRSMKASDVIKENEIIYREKAFAFVPIYTEYVPDTILYHCQNCARTNCLPFPCYDCVRVSYCSPNCLEEHVPIHKYECLGYQKNVWMKIGIGHMAFRCFLTGFRSVLEKLNDLKACNVEQIWTKLLSTKYSNFVYGDVLGMVTNFEKVDINDCLRYALTAKMSAIYLEKYTNYFNDLSTEFNDITLSKEDWINLAASVIMKHTRQFVCNGHVITDIQLTPPTIHLESYRHHADKIFISDLHTVMGIKRIFSAVFPKMSILNHSCDANVRNSYDGSFLTVTASRKIDKDDVIFNCYGPNYKLMSTAQRKNSLWQRYNFVCQCHRCTVDDNSFNDKFYKYVCPNKRCQAQLKLDTIIDRRWWLRINDTIYWESIGSKFICNVCNHRLLLNPKSMGIYVESCLNLYGNGFRSDSTNERLLRYYNNVAKCMGQYHELKMEMSNTFLCGQITSTSPKILMGFANLAVDYYTIIKERFGIYSFEFVIATTYALAIIKEINELIAKGKSPNMRMEFEGILKVFDVDDMEKSYTILSKPMRAIFRNALKELNDKNTPITELVSNLELNSFDDIEITDDGSSEISVD